MSNDKTPLAGLEAKNVSKAFGANLALQDVSLVVSPGEVLCLVGENGAGKSTLGKIFAGYQSMTSGRIYLDGEQLEGLTPRRARDLGIAMVSQEADVVTSVSVAENIFLGDEPTRAGAINWQSMREQTLSLADALGVELNPDAIVDTLSPAQKQMVQILRATRTKARYLVFDEPTASLGASEKTHLLKMVRDLAAQGVGVVYVSHFLDEVFDIGDKAAVLKDGHLVAVEKVSETDTERLIRQMVGRDPESFYQRSRQSDVGEVELLIEGYSGEGIQDVNLEIHGGEIFGFGGLVGSGRTELAELIFGVRKRNSGKLIFKGQDITPNSPAQAISNGICMLTEDRAGQGLLRGASILDNIVIARSERLGMLLKGEKSLARKMVERLHLVPPDVSADIANLSGGNQQKALLARWLAVEDGKIFILDEPTKGVDIGAKHEIYGLIHALAEAGNIVLVISSDLPELLSLSDRIAVMRGGRVVEVVEASSATEESLVKEFVHVERK